MTTAHAEPSAGDHAHDDDHAHAFDDTPIKALPADEPRTPGWLPILGLVLFVGAGVAMLVTGDNPPPSSAAPIPSAIPTLNPEQIQQLRQALDQQRTRGTGAAPVPVPAAPGPPSPRPGAAPIPPSPAAPSH